MVKELMSFHLSHCSIRHEARMFASMKDYSVSLLFPLNTLRDDIALTFFKLIFFFFCMKNMLLKRSYLFVFSSFSHVKQVSIQIMRGMIPEISAWYTQKFYQDTLNPIDYRRVLPISVL